jgi:hypothetical protein
MIRLTAALLFLAETARADYLYRTTFGASNPQGSDNFGSSVTLVLNGSSSLIMASGLPNLVTNPHVEIFRSSNNGLSWSYSQSIICCPMPPPRQTVPFAVAFSDNGNTMLVGKQGSTGDPLKQGATLYFDSNGQYVNTSLDLTITSSTSDGMSVALSGDGNWAFVGAIGVVSYTNTQTGLSKALLLTPSTTPPSSLATNSDGSTLIIGTGANVLVYTAFSYQSSATPTQTILPQLNDTTTFGLSVSLTRDGSILAIGSCGFGVYIYQMTNLTAPSQILTSPDSSTNFGCNVDISDDGRKLIVGSQNAGAVSNGYAYPFRSNGGFFSLESSKIAPPTFDMSYGGGGVAVVNEALDYGIVLVGGPSSGSPGQFGQISVFDSVPTSSATPTATASATSSSSASASNSATYSAIPSPSPLSTATSSASASASSSATATSTMTSTSSSSASASATATATGTTSLTATSTASSTATSTRTSTPSTTTSQSTTSTPSASSSIVPLAANSTPFIITVSLASTGGVIVLVGLGYFLLSWLRKPPTGPTKALFPVEVTQTSPWTTVTGLAGGEGSSLLGAKSANTYSAVSEGDIGDTYRALSVAEGAGGVTGGGASRKQRVISLM